jgi:tRNA G18 (ribose-2'-O)-methylase SpoU
MSRPVIHGFLHNIRSVYNVGSMFRTADGAGVAHLYLAGYTASPAHRKLAKTALGAEQTVAWSSCPDAPAGVAQLHALGYRLWALERVPGAMPLHDVPLPLDGQPLVLMVGNEVAGLPPDMLAQAERVIAIPMAGGKESLNVAVAFGIAVYHLRYGAAG